jgi:NADPH-dependent curcumin reductase CurA
LQYFYNFLGCKVIGLAGTDEKVAWCKESGFDHAINYKRMDLDETLRNIAPNGVDCYFANVRKN